MKHLTIKLNTKASKLAEVFDYPNEKLEPLIQTLSALIKNAPEGTTVGDTVQQLLDKAKPTSIEQAVYIGIIVGKTLA